MLTAEQLKAQYRAGEITEAELERRLERLAEEEGIDALTLSDPTASSAGPELVERGFARWLALATMLVAVAVALPSYGWLQATLVAGAVLSVTAGLFSFVAYSYRRGTLPRASTP